MKLEIEEIQENKDGTVTLQLQWDKEFGDIVKKTYNRKRITKKLLRKLFMDSIKHWEEK